MAVQIPEQKADIQKRELTPEEQQQLDRYRQRKKNQANKLKIRKGNTGENQLNVEHVNSDDPLFETRYSESYGTVDSDVQFHLLNQMVQSFNGILSSGEIDKEKSIQACNTALAILHGIQPQDELEGLLAVQMVGTHNMAMDCMGKATRTDRVDFMNTYMNGATKMLRTFAAQMEALTKYRTGGQQKMTVEHVHVNEGGQAIVGTVNQGGGGNNNENRG